MPKEEISHKITQMVEKQREQLDFYFKKIKFQEQVGGIKYWEIFAETSEINKTTGFAYLKQVKGHFFEDNKPVMGFIAPSARWHMFKKQIFLNDPIGFDIEMKDVERKLKRRGEKNLFILPETYQGKGRGYYFKAKSLEWDIETKNLVCEGEINLVKGNVKGLGERLEADVALENINLSGNPKILIYGKRIVTLEADVFTAISSKDMILAAEVKSKAGDINLWAKTVNFMQKENLIKLLKDVKITYKDTIAESEEAEYELKQEIVTLSGNPKITYKDNTLTGKKIVIDLKKKKFKLIGKTKAVISEEELKK